MKRAPHITTSFRLAPEVKRKLDELAALERRTRLAIVSRLIERRHKDYEKEQRR